MNCPACPRKGVGESHLQMHRRRGELTTRKELHGGRWVLVWHKVEISELQRTNDRMLAAHAEREQHV